MIKQPPLVGARIKLDQLELIKRSSYQSTIHHEKEITKFRYLFLDRLHHQMYVYTGVVLGIDWGEFVDITASVKAIERDYDQIRLQRVVITHKGKRELLL